MVTGFRDDYEGIGVYVYRKANNKQKWNVLTVQNQGGRPVFRMKDNISSNVRGMNNCDVRVEEGSRTGVRLIIANNQIITEVKDSDDTSYKICAT